MNIGDFVTYQTPTGAEVTIVDELPPEDIATLQSLNSREAGGFRANIRKVLTTTGKIIERIVGLFYAGYGHVSIGDCGTTTIFLDNCSILLAKAIQDSELYNGQETSTRYVDVTNLSYYDPIGTPQSKEIIEAWFRFFKENFDAVKAHNALCFPRKDDEDPKLHDAAITARTYDVMRGFLPAGARTNVSWHTNLRQAHDRLAILRYHPSLEIRTGAEKVLEALKAKYRNSFKQKEYPEQEAYRAMVGAASSYFKSDFFFGDRDFYFVDRTDHGEYFRYRDQFFHNRPPKTELPKFLKELGNFRFDVQMDFGSFRDLQRHRNGVNRMPLLTTEHGFEGWYLESLPEEVAIKAGLLVLSQSDAIEAIECDEVSRQYLIALGFKVAWRFTCPFTEAIYVAEMRTGKKVHPTARKVALNMHYALKESYPDLVLHSDTDPYDFDIRRGGDTIVRVQQP